MSVNWKDLKSEVSAIFPGWCVWVWGKGHLGIGDPPDEAQVTFEQLQKLSQLLNTRNINFKYKANEADLSDVTPGRDSDCTIVCRAEVAR